jgi:hypothetical protein
MTTTAHQHSGEARNAYNFAVGYWDALRHRRKVEPYVFAASVGNAVLARYPVVGPDLAMEIARQAYEDSTPNYWNEQPA